MNPLPAVRALMPWLVAAPASRHVWPSRLKLFVSVALQITEAKFVASREVFTKMAKGDSLLSDPDIFFDLLDADKSGSVSRVELQKMFKALLPKGTNSKLIEAIVDEIIVAGDKKGRSLLHHVHPPSTAAACTITAAHRLRR